MNIYLKIGTLAAIALSGAAISHAQYSSASIGVSGGGWYHSEFCTDFHDGDPSRVNELIGVENLDSPFELFYIGAGCEGGGVIGYWGRFQGIAAETYLTCQSGFYMNAMRGYYRSGASPRINSLSRTCRHPSGLESTSNLWIGQNKTGSYASVRCSGGDVAWGLNVSTSSSNPESTLRRVGMLCDPNRNPVL
jgi:hypothetical protein